MRSLISFWKKTCVVSQNVICRKLRCKPTTLTTLSSSPTLCNASTYTFGRKSNIILMGSPGAGKTTVGKLLGAQLGMPVVDMDDHHLEPYWGMSVADKLAEVGSDSFIEEEGKALLEFNCQGSVVSLTGSNPMYKDAMDHITKSGIVVFLDVLNSDIIERLEKMKVNRIIGQEDGLSMNAILSYRQQFYEGAYDIRIMLHPGESPESVAKKVGMAVQNFNSDFGYTSTRNQEKDGDNQIWSFSDVVLQGLAPDGGLFVPAKFLPCFTAGELRRLVDLDYNSRALRILERFIHPRDLHPSKLKRFIDKAYTKETFDSDKVFPVRHLQGNQYLLELFHGPTASFKDAALQLMPQFFVEALNHTESKNRYLILVATSGDTGGAVLDGFARHAGDTGIGVMVMYPEDGISEIQKLKMTSMTGRNVHVVGVEGDFDQCQSFVKMALKDETLKSSLYEKYGFQISAANSISWGRLVPQVVYHVSAYMDLVQSKVINFGDHVDLCVPTGNFGNILAAFYAKASTRVSFECNDTIFSISDPTNEIYVLGIPYRRLICASNANNVLTDFINTGVYDIRRRQLQRSTSPAIDILISSNLERYIYYASDSSSAVVRKCYEDLEINNSFKVPDMVMDHIKKTFVADYCSETQCKSTIQKTLKETGYLLDPHTAVGKAVADRFNDEECPMIIASTAHYAKFGPEVVSFMPELGTPVQNLDVVFNQLDNICDRPFAHKSLVKSVSQPIVHSNVLKAQYNKIRDDIVHYVQSL